jgi:hypothetical protein
MKKIVKSTEWLAARDPSESEATRRLEVEKRVAPWLPPLDFMSLAQGGSCSTSKHLLDPKLEFRGRSSMEILEIE